MQTLLHAHSFTYRQFYTQTLLYTPKSLQSLKLLQREAFTHRGFFTHRHFYTQTHKSFLADALLRAVKDVLADLDMNVIELFAPNRIKIANFTCERVARAKIKLLCSVYFSWLTVISWESVDVSSLPTGPSLGLKRKEKKAKRKREMREREKKERERREERGKRARERKSWCVKMWAGDVMMWQYVGEQIWR